MLRYQHKSFCKMAFIWPPTFVRVLVVECENHEVRYESLATLIGGWNFGVKTYVQTMQKQVFKCRVNLFFFVVVVFFRVLGGKIKRRKFLKAFKGFHRRNRLRRKYSCVFKTFWRRQYFPLVLRILILNDLEIKNKKKCFKKISFWGQSLRNLLNWTCRLHVMRKYDNDPIPHKWVTLISWKIRALLGVGRSVQISAFLL